MSWTNVAPLNRKGYDAESGEPDQNLAWHLERAQQWLELASCNKLASPGDFFEMPDLPDKCKGKVAFCEGMSTLAQWHESDVHRGTAEIGIMEPGSSTAVVTRFNSKKNQCPIEQEWRKPIANGETRTALWIRTSKAPVLPPWQMPATWGELRQACKSQNINVDHLLRNAIGKRFISNTLLLIGFPIPDKIGGPNQRMHWLALKLPDSPAVQPLGFRNNDKGRWQAYKQFRIHDNAVLKWLATENWHQNEVSARGRLMADVAKNKILVIGAGALGSVIAEMLVRAGIEDMTVIDCDRIEAGNLVRHTLLASDIGKPKASTLAARLNAATLHGSIAGIDTSFPPDDAEIAEQINQCDVVIDATGDDKAAAAMTHFRWTGAKTFVSLSVGIHALRMFCFAVRGIKFSRAEFSNRLQPWLKSEKELYDLDDLPRDGPGCWHARHPARIDDLWLMGAAAVRLIEQAIVNPPDAPVLNVFERQVDTSGNFTGIKDVSRDEPVG